MKKPFMLDSLPVKNLDWDSLFSLIISANSAVARYDGLLEGIPEAELLLAPLLLQEAVLSSKIEGTQASLSEVLEFEANPKQKTAKFADIEEVLSYKKALLLAEHSLKKIPLSLRLIKDVHHQLLQGVRGQNRAPGEFRKIQNWIGVPGSTVKTASYVPPSPEKLLDFLSNWEKYCHFEERDRLVQLAIIHAQFELIHPFLDGNGRLGRILIPIFLFDKGILNRPMFYVSAYFEANREQYNFRLSMISKKGDWNGWIEYFLKGLTEQANKNVKKARKILKLYNRMKIVFQTKLKSQLSIQVLDLLFRRQFFTSKDFFTDIKGISRHNTFRVLHVLSDEKIIIAAKEAVGRNPAIYFMPELLGIIES